MTMATQSHNRISNEKRAYTVLDVSRLTSVGRTRLYEEAKAGRLRFSKVGRRTIIRAEDLKAWLDNLNGQELSQ